MLEAGTLNIKTALDKQTPAFGTITQTMKVCGHVLSDRIGGVDRGRGMV